MRSSRARWIAAVLLLLALLSTALVRALTASSLPPIPVPDVLVKVHTESGSVVRDRLIPLGGVPIPIDVDERKLGGLLFPDVDVSVGLIAAEELPGKPIVPTIEVNRDPTALLRKAPAPPLKIDFTIVLRDAGNGLKEMANITYGYETPPGGLAPARFKSKLIGPIAGGFVDPLEAVVLTPGYSAPLKLNADVKTPSFDGEFHIGVNPLPERIHFIEDPRDNGLDFFYDHQDPLRDVKLDAEATLTDAEDGHVRTANASVERLPEYLEVHSTSTDDGTTFAYKHTSNIGKPDIDADYRDEEEDGTLVVDADVKVAGLPDDIEGGVGFVKEDGKRTLDSVDLEVLGEGEIDSVDFLARNYTDTDDPGSIPEAQLASDQYLAAATRQLEDATTRFRAAGRIKRLRSMHFERQGDDNETVDVTTKAGDGAAALTALVDLDDRGPGGPADPEERERMKVDATVRPLPAEFHVNFDPAKGDDPTKVIYDTNQPVDVDAAAEIDGADTLDGCGQFEVTCLEARIDRVSPHLELTLPSQKGTDFSVIRSAGSAGPDVRATVDRTTEDTEAEPSQRTYAEVELLGVPEAVSGRIDTKNGVVRKAEFHACRFDFAGGTCAAESPLGQLERVGYTVRNRPERTGLPPRPDTAPLFVTLLKRFDDFEAAGRVDEVKHVAFHQRDTDESDKEGDGTLGARVVVGSAGEPFDVVVDSVTKDERLPEQDSTTGLDLHVDALPADFSACAREQKDAAPPDPASLPADPLLAACDQTEVLGYGPDSDKGTLEDAGVTPLTAVYGAKDASGAPSPTKVTAGVRAEKPDEKDGDRRHVTSLDATLDRVPANLRVDVIPPVTPDDDEPGRRLELAYDASGQRIDTIDFELETRRANSLCEDPRPDRLATCASGRLKNLPDRLAALYDPDGSVGDIELEAPAAGGERLSVGEPGLSLDDPNQRPLHVSSVTPDDEQPANAAKADRLVFDAVVGSMADRVVGKVQRVNLDSERLDAPGPLAQRIATCGNGQDDDSDGKADKDDADCAPDPARISFDACPEVAPEDLQGCDGVGRIEFRVANSLVGDPLAAVEIPDVPDATQRVSLLQRGEDFRAKGEIANFKRIELSRFGSDDQLSPTTSLLAAFGSGAPTEKIQAYVDRSTGTETQRIDTVIGEAPRSVGLCLRDAVPDPGDVKQGDEFGFCERAPQARFAAQASLDAPAGNVKPDVFVRSFEFSKGGGAQLLTGPGFGGDNAIAIENLGERIDLLAGKGDDAEVDVEGHGIDDPEGAPPQEVAGRVSFDLQNFAGIGDPRFPNVPLDNTTPEPQNDPRNVSGGRHNFIKVEQNRDALRLAGSVPAIKRLSLRSAACEDDPARYPDPDGDRFADVERPNYTCVRALAAPGQPLGLSIRKRDAAGEVLSVDDAVITSLPAGHRDGLPDGLSATIAGSPDSISDQEVCGTPGSSGACRPPLLSLTAPKAGSQQPELQARLAAGPLGTVSSLKSSVKPLDAFSRRLDFERRPADYAQDGARLKLLSSDAGTALRAGLKLNLPTFLDIDPPTSTTCAHEQRTGACGSGEVDAGQNRGFESKDIAIGLFASDTERAGTDIASIGRGAVLVETPESQLVLTGASAADVSTVGDGTADATTRSPENPSPPGNLESLQPGADGKAGAADLGAPLPGHLDARVFMRDEFVAPDRKDFHKKFIQVDGRVNEPLNLALRLNERDQQGRLTGESRNGRAVPSSQFTIRNAPAADEFAEPSFRIRAEVRSPRSDTRLIEGGLAKQFICGGEGVGIDLLVANVCFVLPNPEVRWLDVSLNADPDGPGGGVAPARTIEAVADTTDTKVDMVAFRELFPTGASKEAQARTDFTPQAGLRLAPFDIGLQAGIVSLAVQLALDGDMIVGATGKRNRRLLVGQSKGAIRGLSEGGDARVDAHLFGEYTLRALLRGPFGLGSVPFFTVPFNFGIDTPIPVSFGKCGRQGFGLGANGFDVPSGDSIKATTTLLPPAGLSAPVAAVFTPLSAIATNISCIIGRPKDDPLVVAGHPAPSFDEQGLPPIDGVSQATQAQVEEPEPEPEPEQLDPVVVHQNESRKMCGVVRASRFVVETGGQVVVGAQGEKLEQTVTGPDGTEQVFEVACNGRLTVDAEDIVVEEGGLIAGNGTRGGGPGTPSGTGGGAGHDDKGGDSGSGSAGGNPYPGEVPESLSEDFGSAGAGGSSVEGGRGGGVVELQASDSVNIQGIVRASGGPGENAGSGCGSTGGGGGSGGAIEIDARNVVVGEDALLNAGGGAGGSGGNGGGGGSGGRIRVDAVADDARNRDRTADGGAGGSGACNNGKSGDNGRKDFGVILKLAASVSRSGDAPPVFVRGTVPLEIDATKEGGGKLRVIVCRSSVAFAGGSLNSDTLDPPSSGGPRALMGNSDQCYSFPFDDATEADGVSYKATVELPTDSTDRSPNEPSGGLPDGFHGLYALAANPLVGEDCLSIIELTCNFQDILPDLAQVRLASDATRPVIRGAEPLSGVLDCPTLGSACIERTNAARLRVDVIDEGAGVEGVRCKVNGNEFTQPCGPGDVAISLLGEGPNQIGVQAVDRAGNVTSTFPVATYLVDLTAPTKPTLSLTPDPTDATPTNGWFRKKPTLHVVSRERPTDGSGFGAEPITVLVDGAERNCGTVVANEATCDTAALVPAEGLHTFTAFATDRVGRVSETSDSDTMRVDATKPESRLFLGPRRPDGSAGFYRTRPLFAFAAGDGAGGSGIDFELSPSGVKFAIDPANPSNKTLYQYWDPDDDAANRIAQGTHRICFFAVDVAGNQEDPHCSDPIKVDDTAPVAQAAIAPATPDGTNSFYIHKPVVTASGSDAGGSGVDKVQVQLDGGQWQAAAPITVPEGEHTVRVRAFDNAGNPSEVVERAARVDLTKPAARIESYPPNPNSQGWFRQHRVDSIAASDARDSSGAESATYQLDGGSLVPFVAPFKVEDGLHTVTAGARDRASLLSDQVSQSSRVDTVPPVPAIVTPAPGPILLPNQTSTFRFTVTDSQPTTRVKVIVWVYDVLAGLQRRIEVPGTFDGGFRAQGPGQVTFRAQGLLPGLYDYRVQAIDQAGNSAISTESQQFLVVLGG